MGSSRTHAVLLAVFTGPFCLLTLAASRCVRPWLKPQETNFQTWLAQFLDAETPSDLLFRRLQAGQEDTSEKNLLRPFEEIMRHGTVNQKRHVLAQLASHYSPTFAGVLKLALGDADNGVRVYAATTLAKIEQRYTQQLLAVSAKKEQFPNNPALRLELASLYDDYAWCGVIDKVRQQEMQHKAITLLESVVAGGRAGWPDEKWFEALRRLGRLYIRTQQPRKTTMLYEPLLVEAKNIPASILLWYWESLFLSKNYAALRLAAQATRRMIAPDSLQYHRAADLLGLWLPNPQVYPSRFKITTGYELPLASLVYEKVHVAPLQLFSPTGNLEPQ